jgi:hypothetical protein
VEEGKRGPLRDIGADLLLANSASDATRFTYTTICGTFARHLILDLGLDLAQTSGILGHASSTITLEARHMREIRVRMAASSFARLLEPPQPGAIETLRPLRADRAVA